MYRPPPSWRWPCTSVRPCTAPGWRTSRSPNPWPSRRTRRSRSSSSSAVRTTGATGRSTSTPGRPTTRRPAGAPMPPAGWQLTWTKNRRPRRGPGPRTARNRSPKTPSARPSPRPDTTPRTPSPGWGGSGGPATACWRKCAYRQRRRSPRAGSRCTPISCTRSRRSSPR